MKRSGSVALVLMGAATFAATFAGGMAYFAWQKPSHAATAQPVASQQTCTPRPDGTQSCQPQRRGYAYYFYPRWVSGWSGGSSSSSEPRSRTQTAAFSGTSSSNSRNYSPAAKSDTMRGGFGSTAGSGSYRVSAGG
jgi:hypothetical protein